MPDTKKISPNLRNGTLISLYNNIPVIFECFHGQQDARLPASRKTIAKVPNQALAKRANCFLLSFFLSSSSDNLAQRCLKSVTMVFARNSSIFNRAVQRPIAFSLPPSLHQAAIASFVTPFSRLYACAPKRSLSNERNYSRSLN